MHVCKLLQGRTVFEYVPLLDTLNKYMVLDKVYPHNYLVYVRMIFLLSDIFPKCFLHASFFTKQRFTNSILITQNGHYENFYATLFSSPSLFSPSISAITPALSGPWLYPTSNFPILVLWLGKKQTKQLHYSSQVC